MIAVKEKIAQQYFTGLQGNKKLKLPKTFSNKNHTWQTFHVVVDSSINRNALIKQLREKILEQIMVHSAFLTKNII
ncbi:MAG: DegT/DnrJ/EryC1/StrS family aminotransferase [Bacteroidetes bacterium]|nr:DegT/DnrJ/EryC1/StrS family aminotransferase [Bacteroidota bacterium]